MPRAGRHHHRAFHADKYPQGNQHGLLHLLPQRHAERKAGKIEMELVVIKGRDRQHHEQQQRHQFAERRQQIDACRGLYAAQHQKMHHPQQQRCAQHRLPGIAVAEHHAVRRVGKKAQRRENDHQIGDIGDYRAQPVAPGGTEAEQLAETGARIGKDTAVEVRLQPGEQQHRQRQKQDADAGDQPADQQGGRTCHRRHILRQTEHARAEH